MIYTASNGLQGHCLSVSHFVSLSVHIYRQTVVGLQLKGLLVVNVFADFEVISLSSGLSISKYTNIAYFGKL